MKSLLKRMMVLWSLVVITAYPVIFLYGQNFKEINLEEIVNPIILLEILLGAILLINLILLRQFKRASLITFCMVVLCDYFMLFLKGVQIIIPAMKYWHMCTILLVIWGALIWFNKKISDESVKAGLIGISILANIYVAINLTPVVVDHLQNTNIHSSSDTISANLTDKGMPNIYYLVFDEYSSNEFMKKYYEYDNSSVTDKLTEMGFNISYSSKNEAYMTEICMTNIMNLDYCFDMEDEADDSMGSVITEARKNNLLFQILREHGYEIQGIGDADFYGLDDASDAASLESTTLEGKSFNEIVFENTILGPFVQQNI